MNLAEVTIKDAPQQTGPLKGKCCAQPGDLLKGTFFFGGAGLDGPYISKIIIVLRDIGIKSAIYMDRDKWLSVITFIEPFDNHLMEPM